MSAPHPTFAPPAIPATAAPATAAPTAAAPTIAAPGTSGSHPAVAPAIAQAIPVTPSSTQNVPPRLQPLAALSSTLSGSSTFDTTLHTVTHVRAMVTDLSKNAPGAVSTLPFVRRRGEAIGQRRMNEAERSAYAAWKAGTLLLPKLQNWPSGNAEPGRRANSNPRWMNRAKDLAHLYARSDIGGWDAKRWERHADMTSELLALAMAARRVRNASGKVAERVAERRNTHPENAGKWANAATRAARAELRVLRGVAKDVREVKGALRARMADGIKEVKETESELEKRRVELRTALAKSKVEAGGAVA